MTVVYFGSLPQLVQSFLLQTCSVLAVGIENVTLKCTMKKRGQFETTKFKQKNDFPHVAASTYECGLEDVSTGT